jgi:hypothetical protein
MKTAVLAFALVSWRRIKPVGAWSSLNLLHKASEKALIRQIT